MMSLSCFLSLSAVTAVVGGAAAVGLPAGEQSTLVRAKRCIASDAKCANKPWSAAPLRLCPTCRAYRAADERRTLYLDKAERKKLLDATEPEAAPLVLALCLLALRPGALAKLAAADFDKRTATVTIGTGKNGRPRQITVPQSISGFLAKQVTGKDPATPLLARKNGQSWNKDAWKRPIKDAAATAKLPVGVSDILCDTA